MCEIFKILLGIHSKKVRKLLLGKRIKMQGWLVVSLVWKRGKDDDEVSDLRTEHITYPGDAGLWKMIINLDWVMFWSSTQECPGRRRLSSFRQAAREGFFKKMMVACLKTKKVKGLLIFFICKKVVLGLKKQQVQKP